MEKLLRILGHLCTSPGGGLVLDDVTPYAHGILEELYSQVNRFVPRWISKKCCRCVIQSPSKVEIGKVDIRGFWRHAN